MTCRDHDKELEDLKRALDNLNRPPRSPRPDPPAIMEGSPPDYVLNYPLPEAIRRIKAQRLDIQPSVQSNIQPSIGTSMWPDSCGDVVETRLCPTTIRGVTIKGLEWGNVDIDQQTRLDGLVLEMRRVGSDTFSTSRYAPMS